MGRSSARVQWADKLAGKGVAPRKDAPPSLMRETFRGKILGVDPSLRGTGLAVVDFGNRREGALVESRTVKLAPKLSMAECLAEIHRQVAAMLERHPVDCAAVEETVYVQNFRTAHILGAARGAALAAIALRSIPVAEYPPLRIKQAVAGFGRASKEQVIGTVAQLLQLKDGLPSDEADAAAAAICHAFTGSAIS